jgi:prepilin signal peptidase PulO-like enzyme (type II secretory pathway)
MLTAALFVVCLDRALALGWSPLGFGFLVSATFCSVLIALAFIDLDLGVLPDALTVKTLLPLGAVGSIVVPSLHGTGLFGSDLAEGIKPGLASLLLGGLSAALAFGIMLAVGTVAKRPSSPSTEGEEQSDAGAGEIPQPRHGEAKCAAGIGLLLGFESTLYGLGIALVLAAVIGGARFLLTSRRRVPLGPFLAAGALIALFYPDQLARLLGSG